MTDQTWDTLSDADKTSVLAHCNAGFGVAMDRSESWGLHMGQKLVEVGPADLEASYPGGGDYDTSIFESEAEFTTRQFGLREISANAGLSGTIEGVTGGLGGDMSKSAQKETTHSSIKKTYYLYAEHVVRKVKLTMKDEISGLDPSFEKALRKAIVSGTTRMQRLTAVYGVLNERGWYVPGSMTLGGRLMQSETVLSDKTTDKSKIVTSFEANLKANVGVPGLFDAEGGGGTKTRDENEKNSSLYESISGKHRTFVGGSEQALRDDGLSPWLTSLEEASSWRVVSLDLTPTLNYVPADLLNDIRGLYQTNGAKPEARRHADVDAFKYFGEVETTADAGLASEWA